ncbi:MAG TPA: phosphoribosylanthranilate isomerase [Accumulibacter sp.]|uniref:phosphoribosylanthranilate isomerase n=1 Tax=Accumulibacter sp. TaxID=2053492 RepID=UPI002BAB63DF|nr:phosphoribosylanthranilate isomerase [Accumulibacter sp.]HMV05725.1 phosphoribosylanthranilate isomerase [Accumulibacter sp.]HMW62644.1 phosphoribosylanthranilate isomerase [Accumulibacter sp.]HMX67884.1 phosphoribosylanthranilate isomerase [Accumulibacter sp.]HNC25768.1 phosphoribosylanthranilate isomerase [Accumulibacter sp.]HNE39072.1 phosphoribosylanthranilate isomerase [Accumulibacter sp.]
MKTRIKICGLTRASDLQEAVDAGADALGLVFYPPSPRYVDLATAASLASRVPPLVTIVGLFVNADPAQVRATLAAVPIHLLQMHGDEDEAYCRQFDRPYVKAARVRAGMDLLQYAAGFPSAQALLLDAFVEGYGGGGKVFDWSLVPPTLGKPLILSGGLDAGNVGDAVRRLKPAAVDVSSGVEADQGIKDAKKIRAFVKAVRAADQRGE